jgi:hypothetical protein
MRFDNGAPFGDTHREITPVLALWLIGLGIEVIYNQPFKPQQNAKVERQQGTLGNWVHASSCANYEQFVQRLAFAQALQWQDYPTRTLKGKTRLEVFAPLKHSGRAYDPADFQMQRIARHLAQFRWLRKISAKGAACIYNAYYQVGYAYRNQQTIVLYEPTLHQWQFWNTTLDHLYNALPIIDLDQSFLLNLP